MKKLIILISVFVFLFIGAGLASANLLVNGDAESGNLNPWDSAPFSYKATDVGAPQSGSYFFRLDNGLESDWMSQTGTTGLDVDNIFELSGWCQTDGYDVARASISFYNASNEEFGTIFSDIVSEFNAWEYFTISTVVPDNAVSWEVKLNPQEYHFGTSYNADWDSLSLTSTPVPIPAAIVLLGSGLFGLVGFRRQLKKS
ncbi:MAG: VPLPA-CTERM sorting domain-containing protein [Pseudomonadota bacterium]